jgi:hypothetical protein
LANKQSLHGLVSSAAARNADHETRLALEQQHDKLMSKFVDYKGSFDWLGLFLSIGFVWFRFVLLNNIIYLLCNCF